MIRVLGLIAALWVSAGPAWSQARAFVAVEAADVEVSTAWYAQTFEARLVNTISRPAFEARVLESADLIIEVLQRTPPMPPRPAQSQGLFKSGVVVDDLDSRMARWTAEGVRMRGERFHDPALNLDAILLLDPDGNRIQVFGPPATDR
jgi:predicted enzyme related to lactoylglutathione lyase